VSVLRARAAFLVPGPNAYTRHRGVVVCAEAAEEARGAAEGLLKEVVAFLYD
jgi:hypothetical protein